MKKILLSFTLILSSLMLISCSETEDSKESIIAKPQLDALEKAKNVEKELLKRKKQLDDEEVKY